MSATLIRPANPAVFNFNGAAVRVAMADDGEPWFVAGDVAAVLDYRDAFNMVRLLDDDEKGTQKVSTLGGQQGMAVINESGPYSAILRSNKPQARQFKKWVTSEVLPAIRKTGSYHRAFTVPEALRLAADFEEKRLALVAENAVLRPKAALTDRISTADGLRSVQAVAKTLGYGPNRFFALLRGYGIFYRRDGVNLPKQCFVDRGYFRTREQPYHDGETTQLYTRIFVTGKGELWLAKRFNDERERLASSGEAV